MTKVFNDWIKAPEKPANNWIYIKFPGMTIHIINILEDFFLSPYSGPLSGKIGQIHEFVFINSASNCLP